MSAGEDVLLEGLNFAEASLGDAERRAESSRCFLDEAVDEVEHWDGRVRELRTDLDNLRTGRAVRSAR